MMTLAYRSTSYSVFGVCTTDGLLINKKNNVDKS